MTFTQFLSILRARWKLSALVFALTVSMAVAVSLVLPKKYQATASLVVDMKPDPITGAMLGGMANATMMATQADVIASPRVAKTVIRNLKLAQNPDVQTQWQEDTNGESDIEDWLVGGIQKQLDVKPSRESNVINISYIAPDPKFAAAIANEFSRAYLETSLELRTDPAKKFGEFFEQRALDARKTLEDAQAKLTEYQQTNGLVGAGEGLDIETQRLNELSSQLVMMQSIATESESRSRQGSLNADRMAETLNSPVVNNLKIEIGKLEASIQEMGQRLGGSHPQLLQARANLDELKKRLDTETKRTAGVASMNATVNNSRVGELKAQIEAQRAKLLRMKDGKDSMAVLRRDVDNAQRAYDALVSRANQAMVESQTQAGNVSVLSAATPALQPSSPKILLNTLVAIFLGTALALFAAILTEAKDRRLRSDGDIAEYLGVAVIGAMPRPISRPKQLPNMALRVISGRK